MERRALLARMAGVSIGSGIAGCGGLFSKWETVATVRGEDATIHTLFIGEMEEGDSIEVEIVVEQGVSTRFGLLNRDTGEYQKEVRVYRSEEIEGYDDERHTVSPYRDTITISDFGEYEIRIITPRDYAEVIVRYAEE